MVFGTLNSEDGFGLSVAASRDSILVGNRGQHATHPFTNDAYVFTRGASGWALQQKLRVQEGDVAIDGDTLVAGGVIYVRSGGIWTVQSSVNVEVADTALQGDTLVVGSPFDPTQDHGSVQVYVRSGATWSQQAFLRPAANDEMFGNSVGLDGDTLIGGTAMRSGTGLAYIYVRAGGTWSLQATLSLAGGGTGMEVAIEADTAVVSDVTNSRVGIFTRAGTTWTLTQTLASPSGGSFGVSVALKGGVLAVGAGPVSYLYTRTAAGWVLAQTISSAGASELALADNGKLLVIGFPADNTQSFDDGAATVYSVAAPPAPGSGWRDYDVGTVGVAGSSSDDGTTVTVGGSGTDIWDRADQFHFRSETLTGDGTIIARVNSAGNSNGWAKVGLMFREDLAPAARSVMAFVTPGGPSGTEVRADPADLTSFQDAGWTGAPLWLKLVRAGNQFTAYRSDDGGSWSTLGSASVVMPDTIHVGLAVSSHDNSALDTATFTNVQLIRSVPPPPGPSDWTGQDIGDTGSVGSHSGNPPTVTMNAGGADIFGTSDSFRALYTMGSGDTTVVARVAAMTNTHPWAKAGVMIRASLSPDAPNAAMLLTAANVCVFQARPSAGADTSSTSGGWFNAPYWVKLTRVGNTFSGYISADGVGWTLVGSQDVAMSGPVCVALAGSSHDPAAQTAISFSNIAVATASSAPLAAPANLQVTNVTASGAHLTWADNSNNEEGFRIYAENDDPHAGFQLVGSAPANATSADIGLQSDSHYYIVVASYLGTGESWSDAVTVSTLPAPDAPPPAPPHIAVDPDASNSLRVSWEDASTTETGFEIERATGGGPFAVIGSVGANVAFYSDSALTAGTTYSYRVRAANGTHYSDYSPVGSAMAVAAPADPTGIAIGARTDTSLQVSWTDASNNETGFELQRATGGGDFSASFQVAANTTSFADTGLAAGQTYSYRVRACNSFNSGFSPVATGATTGGSPPPPPAGWTGRDIGNTGSTGLDSGSVPYVTMYAGGADIFGTADSFHGLFSSEQGDVTMVAQVDSMTNTHPWAKAGVMIRASLSPDAPNAAMLLTAANVCVFQARPTAGAETSSTSGGWFNAPYWVKLTRVGDTFTGYISADGTSWTSIGSQVIAMPAQVYVGIAGCSHDPGAQTGINFAHIALSTPAGAPAAPNPVTASNVTAGSAHLSWGDNSSDEDGFRIYTEYVTRDAGLSLVATVGPGVTSFDVTGLGSDSNYRLYVASFRGGEESFRNSTSIMTPHSSDQPPAAPESAFASRIAPDTARVNWAYDNATGISFEVERAASNSGFSLVTTVGPNVTTYTDTGISPSNGYIYRVRAVNGAGTSSYAQTAFFPPVAPPAAPTGLAVGAATDTSLQVSWTDPSDYETGFELQRATGAGGFTAIFNVPYNAHSFSDTGLAAGQSYSYRVRSTNGSFSSEFSATATGTTTGGTPPPPPSDALAGSDIGTTGSTGSESGAPPTVTMNAGGTDIFGTADGFRGMFKVATGDMRIVAKVDSMTNTHPWAKAGVMIRASLSPDSPNAAMLLTAGNVCVFQARTDTAGSTTSTSGGWFNAPYWVKLEYSGDFFYGSVSPDGVTWTLVGSQMIFMRGEAYIGLAGCSHDPGAQTTISFSHVTVDATRMPYAPGNFHAVATGPHTVRLTWQDNSDNETAFKIRMDTQIIHSPNPFLYTTVAANVTTCDVTGLQANHDYVFFVSAANETQELGWLSNPAYATTPQDTAVPPLAPEHISIYRSGAGSLHAIWDNMSTTETGFEVERATGSGAFAVVGTTGAGVTNYTDSGLTDGTTYSYRVRAVNGAGYSGYSPVGSDTVSAAPETPVNRGIDARTDSTLHLTWSDTSNNETGFRLLRSTASAPDVIIQVAANTTDYTDTGLASGTTYSYRVQAYNDLNSGYSEVASESTYGIAPPPPSSDWTSRDIGNVGLAGSASGLPPTVSMNAAGSDIFNSADGFHSLFKTETGDMTVIARVASMTNTHSSAKAGVMIRASLDPESPYAAMLLTAGNVCTFQTRFVEDGATEHQDGGWFNAPYWVKLVRVGNTFTGYISPDGVTWTLVGSYGIEMAAQVYVGLAGCSHNPGALTTITFDGVAETGTPPPPPAWTRVAWNAGSSSGEVHEGGDAIIIRGMSGDIWDQSDSGTFMYRPVTGDDLLKVRVDTVTFADVYSKAGLMFRATLDSFSPNVCVVMTARSGIIFQVRNSAGGVTTAVREVQGLQAPVRLWLGRTGNQFLAAYSTDEGATWIPLGEVTVAMPADAYLGVIGASHNPTFESSAAFSNIPPD